MASIIRTPKFDREARLLSERSAPTAAGRQQPVGDEPDAPSREAQQQDALARKNTELEATIVQLRAQIDALQEEGEQRDYAQGFDLGREDAITQVRAAVQDEIDSLESVVDSIRQQAEAYLRNLEQINVESIFAAVGKIIGKSVEDPDTIRALVQEQLQQVISQHRIILRLAPQDHQFILDNSQSGPDPLLAENIQLVADDHVQYGGCIVETDGGGLDARLDIQMQRFREMLLDVYARRQAGDL